MKYVTLRRMITEPQRDNDGIVASVDIKGAERWQGLREEKLKNVSLAL
jgi:hypothetical protein